MTSRQRPMYEIGYRCACLGDSQPQRVAIPHRIEGEDLIAWHRDKVVPAVRRAHLRLAASCPGDSLTITLTAEDGAPMIGCRPKRRA